MDIIDRSELTDEQRSAIEWQANLLEEDYTHALVNGERGDYEVLELVTDVTLADYITDPQFKLVRL